MYKFIIIGLVLLMPAKLVAQNIHPSAEENGNLRFVGNLKNPDKTADKISNCLSTWLSLMGLDSVFQGEQETLLTGNHSYTYSPSGDNTEERAGEISFKYTIKVRDGVLIYRFYDFEHLQQNSKYNSVGSWPLEWNDRVGESFTRSQFQYIMFDLKFNISNIISIMNKHCMTT